jgi:hypothetical protein
MGKKQKSRYKRKEPEYFLDDQMVNNMLKFYLLNVMENEEIKMTPDQKIMPEDYFKLMGIVESHSKDPNQIKNLFAQNKGASNGFDIESFIRDTCKPE